MTKKKSTKPQKLTAKQKKLIALMPKVELGKITVEKAMLKAGYAKSTARQQTDCLRNIRENSAMQDALRDVGVNEDGNLLLETVNGIQVFNAGEVSLRTRD